MMVVNNLNDNTSDYAEKVQRCQQYIGALEEERRKINVFQRELPLCLELVTQAIEACKHQLTSSASSECSEQISSEGPVLEEFMPIKRAASSDDEEHQSKKPNNCNTNNDIITKDSNKEDDKASKKSDWLRSTQLWNQTTDPITKEDSPKKVKVIEVKRNESNGAFHPFKGEKSTVETSSISAQKPCGGGGGGGKLVPATVAAASSSVDTGGSSGGANGGGKKEDKEGQSQKKHRRCWAPDLHKRFLKALQQLGGPHVATPKQIRELMKVDGLTNDEVKSHLQKYRLHSRRPSPSHNTTTTTTTQTPQFVVVGGIWMPPPPEYAAMATPTVSGAATSNEICTPIATPPLALHKKNLHSNSSHSSSSDTTIASPPAYN